MDDTKNIRPDEWIPASEAFRPKAKPPVEPKIDQEVSKAVGINVRVGDPRVLKKVVEWRRQNPNESTTNNDYLKDPKKVEELKEELR